MKRFKGSSVFRFYGFIFYWLDSKIYDMLFSIELLHFSQTFYLLKWKQYWNIKKHSNFFLAPTQASSVNELFVKNCHEVMAFKEKLDIYILIQSSMLISIMFSIYWFFVCLWCFWHCNLAFCIFTPCYYFFTSL